MKPDHSQDLFGRPLPVHVRQETLDLRDGPAVTREGHALASTLPMDPRTVPLALGDVPSAPAALVRRYQAAGGDPAAARKAADAEHARRLEATARPADPFASLLEKEGAPSAAGRRELTTFRSYRIGASEETECDHCGCPLDEGDHALEADDFRFVACSWSCSRKLAAEVAP